MSFSFGSLFGGKKSSPAPVAPVASSPPPMNIKNAYVNNPFGISKAAEEQAAIEKATKASQNAFTRTGANEIANAEANKKSRRRRNRKVRKQSRRRA